MEFIGYTLIVIGMFFIVVGIVGVYRFHNFYSRLLSAADIDTVGLMTILGGVACLSGFNSFTLKLMLILGLLVILNPVVTSSIAASAFFSGYKLMQEEDKETNEETK